MTTVPQLSPDALGTPCGIADPYPLYRALRDRSPVRYLRVPAGAMSGRSEPLYAHAVLRHADVLAVVRSPAAFSSQTPALLQVVPRLALVHDDPPRHTQVRRLVNKAFTVQRVAALAGSVGTLAEQLLEPLASGVAEIMQAYAMQLPIRVIAALLGIPEQDYPAFRRWSEATVGYTTLSAAERAPRLAEMDAYLAQAITARRTADQGDLISALATSEIDGTPLTDLELRRIVAVLLIAGNETTIHLLGNMLGLLAERPELWEQARADRSLVEPIIDEVLRFESPVQRFSRVTTRPVEVGGVPIAAGELLDVFYGAANRDPAVFAEPDTFRLGRPAAEHLAWGAGIHFCLGSHLARLEAKLTLNAFLDRYSQLARGPGGAERQASAQLSFGWRTLPLALHR